MLSGRSTYKATAPAPPPMDLNSGKPAPGDAILSGGVTLAFWAASAFGAWLATLFGPHGYEGLDAIGWGRLIGMVFGVAVGVAGFSFGLDFARLTRRSWIDYYRRLNEWHEVAADSWQQQGGQTVEELTNEWELRADKPDEVWYFITAMHRAVHQGQDAPWALRRVCEDGVWMGNRKLAINTNQARLMVDNLATMGYITGRTERHPGNWVPQTLDQAAELYDRNAKKVL